MTNHAHLLFRTGTEPLSGLMRRLLTGYVTRQAMRGYKSFVKEGFKQGRKEELTGGGLIRSLGGWIEAREVLKRGVHVMSDDRILGDDEFTQYRIFSRAWRIDRKRE